MTGSPITLGLQSDTALMLFDMLARFEQGGPMQPSDPAEQQALWDLQCELERVLVDPLRPDYAERLSAARARLASASDESGVPSSVSRTEAFAPLLSHPLRIRRPGEILADVSIHIGRPYQRDSIEWRCPVMIAGLESRYPDIAGGNAVQALCLALSLVRARLDGLLAQGSELFSAEDDVPLTRADIADLLAGVSV